MGNQHHCHPKREALHNLAYGVLKVFADVRALIQVHISGMPLPNLFCRPSTQPMTALFSLCHLVPKLRVLCRGHEPHSQKQ